MQTGVTGAGAGWLIQTVTVKAGLTKHFKFDALLESHQLGLKTAATGSFRIGLEHSSDAKVNMELAQALVYNRAITASERVTLVAHLSDKYGL